VLVPAAFVQLLAALGAGALAALDSYGTAALGFALGGVVGLVVFAALGGSHGIVALAWGLAANAACALAVPAVALARRGALRGRLPEQLQLWSRLRRLLEGAAVPLAIQACYLLAPSFSYAFLVASTLVNSTAFSLGLISSAPLTRRGIDAVASARHVVHAAWVSLSLVGAAAGVFVLVGGRIMGVLLGSAYAGGVGQELGRLVVYLAPWMLGWVGFAVAYPLVFVSGRERLLVPLAATGFLACIPLGLGLRALDGLEGIAIAIGLATLLMAAGLLWMLSPRTLAIAALGLARLALAIGAATAFAFGGLSLVLPAVPAAVLGVLLYAAVVWAMRSLGLSEAWAYVRGLH
jgi:hypothetical protein